MLIFQMFVLLQDVTYSEIFSSESVFFIKNQNFKIYQDEKVLIQNLFYFCF